MAVALLLSLAMVTMLAIAVSSRRQRDAGAAGHVISADELAARWAEETADFDAIVAELTRTDPDFADQLRRVAGDL